MITFTLKLKDHKFEYTDPITNIKISFNADVIHYNDRSVELSAYNYKANRYLPPHQLEHLKSKSLTHYSNLINAKYNSQA